MSEIRTDVIPVTWRQKAALSIIAKAIKTNTAQLVSEWLDAKLKADHADVLEFLDKQDLAKQEFMEKQEQKWKNMRPSKLAEELE